MLPIARGMLSFALIAILSAAFCGSAAAQQHLTGSLPDGATYVIDVPGNWNGTLLLYSHGYVAPGQPNPALDVSDPLTGGYMLAVGNALAGSSYASTGWAVAQAIPDQIATLGVFQTLVGTPKKTIAWGHSLGGMITAGLVQEYPSTFNAALPMCGVVAGGVGIWNQSLDAEFAFNTLIAGGTLQVVDITNPTRMWKPRKLISPRLKIRLKDKPESPWWRPSLTPLDGTTPHLPSPRRPTTPIVKPISFCGCRMSTSPLSLIIVPSSKHAREAILRSTTESTTERN
jgi:pimeloyl-ACP methyl ester carboxylesterase